MDYLNIHHIWNMLLKLNWAYGKGSLIAITLDDCGVIDAYSGTFVVATQYGPPTQYKWRISNKTLYALGHQINLERNLPRLKTALSKSKYAQTSNRRYFLEVK